MSLGEGDQVDHVRVPSTYESLLVVRAQDSAPHLHEWSKYLSRKQPSSDRRRGIDNLAPDFEGATALSELLVNRRVSR
jgi:hypothetical protein